MTKLRLNILSEQQIFAIGRQKVFVNGMHLLNKQTGAEMEKKETKKSIMRSIYRNRWFRVIRSNLRKFDWEAEFRF